MTNKVKEITFKILHRCYPTNHYLTKFKKDLNSNCSFCDVHPETLLHLFWHYEFVKMFWKDLIRFVIDHIDVEFSLYMEHVLVGFNNVKHKIDQYYIINLIIMLAKFYIHKCKVKKSIPLFMAFEIEIKMYMQTILGSTNRKASKTINICKSLGLFL